MSIKALDIEQDKEFYMKKIIDIQNAFLFIGEVCKSDFDCLYGARCVRDTSSSSRICSCALLPCAEEEALSENRITSNPVCGSDGITYRNICGLQLAACGKGRNITVMKTEPCDGDYDDLIGKLGFA